MKLSIRTIALVVIILLVVAGIAYTYFSWDTMQQLTNTYNTIWLEDAKLGSGINKINNDFIAKLKKGVATADPSTLSASYSALIGQTNLLKEAENNYLQKLSNDMTAVDAISFKTNFLFGERAQIAKEIITDQKKYDELAITIEKKNITADYFLNDFFTMIIDSAPIAQFEKDSQANPQQLYADNFSEIASVEKYTEDPFHFDHEDEIKKTYPKGYDMLQRYKNFLSAYYTYVKQTVNGDTDGANYTAGTLQDAKTNLNVDYASVFTQGKDADIANEKKLLGFEIDQIQAVKQYKKDNLYRYPLLAQNKNWEEDLSLCEVYEGKTDLFYNITNDYMKASKSAALFPELSSISPKTDDLDNQFNTKTMQFTNGKDTITFICKDTLSKKEFPFALPKTN